MQELPEKGGFRSMCHARGAARRRGGQEHVSSRQGWGGEGVPGTCLMLGVAPNGHLRSIFREKKTERLKSMFIPGAAKREGGG